MANPKFGDMDDVKLADELLACLDSLLQVRIGQMYSMFGCQCVRRRNDILDLKLVGWQIFENILFSKHTCRP